MKSFKYILVLCVLLAAAFAFPHVGLAKSGTIVRVSPEETLMDPNTTADIEIWVEGVEDLWAFSITLEFDPDLIQVVDADPSIAGVQVVPGSFLESESPRAMVVTNTVDNGIGVINFGLTQLRITDDDPLPQSGSGVLLRFTVLSKDMLDVTELVIGEETILSKRDGTLIETALANGWILIDGKKSFDVFIPLFIR